MSSDYYVSYTYVYTMPFDTATLEMDLWGLTLGQWVILIGLWGLLTGLLLLARRVLRTTLKRVTVDAAAAARGYLEVVVGRTRLFFLAGVGLYGAALLSGAPERHLEVLATVVFLIFLIQLIFWVNGVVTRYVDSYKEYHLETDAAAVTTVQAMGFIGRLIVYTLVFLLAVDNLGYEVTALLASLGIGGIAVALALQNILGDLFASLSIVLDKPFVVGDFLVIDGFSGTVEYIGLKTTRLRSLSGEQLVFSNSDLLQSRIRNYKRMFERRILFTFGVVYQTPYAQLEAIPRLVQDLVEAQDQVRFDRAHFKDYGDSALTFEVVYYVLVPDYNTYMDIQERINLGLFRTFEARGIAFAYPTRTVYMSNGGGPGVHHSTDDREN